MIAGSFMTLARLKQELYLSKTVYTKLASLSKATTMMMKEK